VSDHKAQPRIRGGHMVCAECGDRVYQRLTRRATLGACPVHRRTWSHLGHRNTTGLRRSLVERSGGSYEGENFGTGLPGR
jgi:hypothetical protein